jgi:CubicO group peptidase (beta-lactamase class C family)
MNGRALGQIRSYVERHRTSLDTPGLALAVTDRERVLGVLTDGLANIDAGLPVDPEHRFQIGSISKGFTAMALLQEWEVGRLDLDAPVTEYLPWFEVRTRFAPITVHHLLSHTGGITCGTDATGEAAAEVWSVRETHTGFAPGERFLYSNLGYKALGLVLERVAGRPWWEVVRERVMAPIGMGDADVIITPETRARLAVGYASPFDDRPWLPRHGWAASPWFESATADGTICATAGELTAYARLLLNRGRGVLTEGGFARMTEPVIEDPEAPGHRFCYGIKWIEEPGSARVLGHSGGMIGFTAYALVDPRAGFGVTVLMNSAFGVRLGLARFALSCLAAEAVGDPLPAVPDPPDPNRVEGAAGFTGTYRGEGETVEVTADGDRLFVEHEGVRAALVPFATDRFVVDEPTRERYPFDVVREEGVVTQAMWGPRWLRHDRYQGPTAFGVPAAWSGFAGRYRSWNPWAPGFDVFLRGGRLWLGFVGDVLDWGGDMPLVPLEDGSFQVGEHWAPDRVRFDTVIDGRATRAILDAAPYYRAAAH